MITNTLIHTDKTILSKTLKFHDTKNIRKSMLLIAQKEINNYSYKLGLENKQKRTSPSRSLSIDSSDVWPGI